MGITEGSYRLTKSWGFLGIFFKMVSNYLNMLRKRVFYTLLGGRPLLLLLALKHMSKGYKFRLLTVNIKVKFVHVDKLFAIYELQTLKVRVPFVV